MTFGEHYIDVKMEHYWLIPGKDSYDNYEHPKEFSLGKLSDDWQNLQKVATGEVGVIPYDLVRLAAVLRALGETLTA